MRLEGRPDVGRAYQNDQAMRLAWRGMRLLLDSDHFLIRQTNDLDYN